MYVAWAEAKDPCVTILIRSFSVVNQDHDAPPLNALT